MVRKCPLVTVLLDTASVEFSLSVGAIGPSTLNTFLAFRAYCMVRIFRARTWLSAKLACYGDMGSIANLILLKGFSKIILFQELVDKIIFNL